VRYIAKCYCDHSVNSTASVIGQIVIPLIQNEIKTLLIQKTLSIIQAQKSNPRYDYASHEQIEIDKLVYEAYGLSPEDVEEVENWYIRRYPKLSAARKHNLRNLGKSDDYLVLYGYK
jgi:hypothetical protein